MVNIAPKRQPRQWAAVLVRYSIPLLGVYLLGWPPLLLMLGYWFDSVVWLAAILVCTMPGTRRDLDQPVSTRFFVITYVFIYLLIGAPMWLYLGLVNQLIESADSRWVDLINQPTVYFAAAASVLCAIAAVKHAQLSELSSLARKSMINWEYGLAMTRIIVMLAAGLFLPLNWVFVPLLAFVLIELYPLRAMTLLGAPVSARDRVENIAV
ncbi:MAG: hypothetical protein DHS20C11_31180 [Lysobacteraceae bacterium]|nr:MAG: hypothetical protein DHS20C11_31180 [Xanthomonadaceae bacterium]